MMQGADMHAAANRAFRLMMLRFFAVVSALVLLLIACALSHARDLDGRFSDSPLKLWFDGLKSGKGLCCSFADGVTIKNVDWTDTNPDKCTVPPSATDEPMSGYCVRLNGTWLRVPQSAVITEPNRFGDAVVWPIVVDGQVINIRCFIPGSGA